MLNKNQWDRYRDVCPCMQDMAVDGYIFEEARMFTF